MVEIRSVNHRFLEVECRVPEGLQAFEEAIRSQVSGAFRRGQVRVSVSLKATQELPAVELDAAVARRYVAQLRGLKRRLGISGDVTLEMLLGLPQVVSVSERNRVPSARLWAEVRKGVGLALVEAARMRRREGARLQRALERLLRGFVRLHARIRRRAPLVQRQMERRLAQRICVMLRGAGQGQAVSDRRAVLTEAASLVQATDVSEEMDRLESHLEALRHAVRGGNKRVPQKGSAQSSPGRTIDFLAQELQREVNTLGTKLRDGAVVRAVVDFKGQIEKLREQAANLE